MQWFFLILFITSSLNIYINDERCKNTRIRIAHDPIKAIRPFDHYLNKNKVPTIILMVLTKQFHFKQLNYMIKKFKVWKFYLKSYISMSVLHHGFFNYQEIQILCSV